MTTSAVRDALDLRPALPAPSMSGAPPRTRIASLDIVRGIVMVLMAIDHVRVYSGNPAGGPTPGIFFTRWVTHFVAPAFVFLAGTAAYLHGDKLRDRAALSRFLVTRGAWLVVLELTVLRVAWTFNLDFAHYMLAGVIWMIGWCMIAMAVLIRLPVVALATTGVAVIALHDVTDFFQPQLEALSNGAAGWLVKLLYTGGVVRLGGDGGPPLFVLFVIIPWVAVMMVGYAFGVVMRMPAERRRTICLRLGVALTVAFVLLRGLDLYGDPSHWRAAHWAPAPLRFLATNKYPASLDFLLMTLGPMFVALALAERARGWVADVVATYGRVPMWYYLLHIPAIHAAACVVSLIREGSVNPWLFANHPMNPGRPPEGYRWGLPLLYAVWAIVVAALYVPCRWYAGVKARSRSPWLSYL